MIESPPNTRRGGQALLWLAAWSLGCGATTDDPRPPLEWHGERVSLGTDLVDEVCPGTLAALDRGILQIEAELGLAASSERISFWALTSDLLEQIGVCPSGRGCALRSIVYLSGGGFQRSYLHELVHARQRQLVSSNKRLFEEGLATALGGGGGCLAYEDCARAELDDLLSISTSGELGLPGYTAGADLVHGMLAEHGPAEVLAFLAELERDTPPAEVRKRYQSRFGRSLTDDYSAYLRGPLSTYTPAQLECDAPAAPVAGPAGGILLQADMDCGDPQVVDDFARASEGDPPGGLVEWTFVVEPRHAGVYTLSGSTPAANTLSLRRCAPHGFVWEHLADEGPWTLATNLPPNPPRTIVLGPGLHQIVWRDSLDQGARLDLRLVPACTFEAQDCPLGQQCTIWNACEPQVEQPAPLGATCSDDGPTRACEAGARCVGGVCTAECDATRECAPGSGCARIRVCGGDCDLVAQDCPTGSTCLPAADPARTAAGKGQCVAAGAGEFLAGCDRREGGCAEGLSCEFVRVSGLPDEAGCADDDREGCCVPLCDPSAADPGCPESVPFCDPIADGPAGVCRTQY
ncbi:hypothetical protein [Nannocystis punicea]|uniref:Uncharacterized protein n=1 Tax=Nannocystis punicea TaxID=2995304 RepID=A0ABY7GXX0_9BACT|nr:hypothetical protein [Nannocystis poenicansa]WAS91788.1 hypothetical protein O0S08_36865 [Nannocystis poenicansa]